MVSVESPGQGRVTGFQGDRSEDASNPSNRYKTSSIILLLLVCFPTVEYSSYSTTI